MCASDALAVCRASASGGAGGRRGKRAALVRRCAQQVDVLDCREVYTWNARAPRGRQRSCLITGGAKRVGAAICRRLHAAGANLMLHYRASAGEARLLQAELNHVARAIRSR